MSTATRTRKTSRKSSARGDARKAEVELAVQLIDDEAPDFAAFLNRWSGRYAENNLRRLWVQCPHATALHKFGTWQGMGRQVRRGEHAILLMQPRTSFDETRITPANPEGRVFYGASWMALFDYSQTDPIGDFTETAGQDADQDLLAEVKRLQLVAVSLHPDMTGEDTAAAFVAAWAAYEAAKARL